MSASCPEHGPPAEPDHRFCEVCGRNLATGELPAPPPVQRSAPATPGRWAGAQPRWRSSRAPAGECAGCGQPGPAGTGYCDHCGRRRSAGSDHAELEMPGVAAVTDRAKRRHNEDAVAIGRLDTTTVVVVCDGVSTSSRSDAAAHAAAEAGLSALLAALEAGDPADRATRLAAEAAAQGAREAADPADTTAPPSCTYVSAVVAPGSVTVGWIGDSRAYWLSAAPGDSARLTVDDSLAERLAEAGAPAPEGGVADRRSRALVRWLGADAAEGEPDVTAFTPTGPGRLVLCSDGLSHYLPDPEDMAKAAGPGSPLDVARGLTSLAIEAGGHDNVTVAVAQYPPSEGPDR